MILENVHPIEGDNMTRKKTTRIPAHQKTSKKGKPFRVSAHPRKLPRKPIRHIIIDQGAVRVSEKAADELGEELELHGKKISKRAVQYAREDGRKTVKDRDIKKAASDFHTSFHKEK